MLLKFDEVTTVEDVPVGRFFYMKRQGGELELAFMAKQVSQGRNGYEGPVVLLLPEDGSFSMPRAAAVYPLAVAAILPKLEVAVETEGLEESSTESFVLLAGRLVLSGGERLVTFERTAREQAKFVNLDSGELSLGSDPGTWLAFTRWQLQLQDGTPLYTASQPAAP